MISFSISVAMLVFIGWLFFSSMQEEIKHLRGQVEYYRGMWDRQVLRRREPEDDADWWKSGEHDS